MPTIRKLIAKKSPAGLVTWTRNCKSKLVKTGWGKFSSAGTSKTDWDASKLVTETLIFTSVRERSPVRVDAGVRSAKEVRECRTKAKAKRIVGQNWVTSYGDWLAERG